MDFSKLRPLPKRHERLVHLHRCDKCGDEEWFVIEMPEHLLEHERRGILGTGPRCGGSWEHVASGYEHEDGVARAARAAAREAR